MAEDGRRIDPADPLATGTALHELLDTCLDRLGAPRDCAWQAPPADMASRVALDGAAHPDLGQALAADVMPYGTGNTHPRFWGWVHALAAMPDWPRPSRQQR